MPSVPGGVWRCLRVCWDFNMPGYIVLRTLSYFVELRFLKRSKCFWSCKCCNCRSYWFSHYWSLGNVWLADDSERGSLAQLFVDVVLQQRRERDLIPPILTLVPLNFKMSHPKPHCLHPHLRQQPQQHHTLGLCACCGQRCQTSTTGGSCQ